MFNHFVESGLKEYNRSSNVYLQSIFTELLLHNVEKNVDIFFAIDHYITFSLEVLADYITLIKTK